MRISLVAADLSKLAAYGHCIVTGLWGYNQQATDRYVLFFETLTAAGNDVSSVKSFNFPAQTSASYSDNAFGDGLSLSQLLVAISTDPQKLTAPAADGGIDLTVEFESSSAVRDGVTTVVGDLSSAVAFKQIWTSAAGPKKLLRLDVTNLDIADAFAVIQASDAALTTDSTGPGPFKILAGATRGFSFGISGHTPIRLGHKGCTIRMVTADGDYCPFPYVFDAVANYNIRAVYE